MEFPAAKTDRRTIKIHSRIVHNHNPFRITICRDTEGKNIQNVNLYIFQYNNHKLNAVNTELIMITADNLG